MAVGVRREVHSGEGKECNKLPVYRIKDGQERRGSLCVRKERTCRERGGFVARGTRKVPSQRLGAIRRGSLAWFGTKQGLHGGALRMKNTRTICAPAMLLKLVKEAMRQL